MSGDVVLVLDHHQWNLQHYDMLDSLQNNSAADNNT